MSPALCRLTFDGESVRSMKTCAPDQRIKMFFPTGRANAPCLPGDGWLAAYQAMSPAQRPARRTYTIRALRADRGELDVEFVLHGATGPASAWATEAEVGSSLQLVAPNRAFERDPGGYEWRPPAGPDELLLIGDETALPALAGILEEVSAMPSPPRARAFIEVPTAEDVIVLPTWSALDLTWLPRKGDAEPGALMVQAARREAPRAASQHASPLPEIDVDREILWETGARSTGGFYAWIAGEAGAVKTIRHVLLKERGFDRAAVNLMGYWRLGQALE